MFVKTRGETKSALSAINIVNIRGDDKMLGVNSKELEKDTWPNKPSQYK